MEEKNCGNCKFSGVPPIGDPCKGCTTLERWEPKFIPAETPFQKVSTFTEKPIDNGVPVVGFDPGAPEGNTTNTQRVWPLDGREIFSPKVWIDDTESGPVLAVTRMPLETVIGYAIEGVKDRASKIGLKLTDKTMSEHDLDNAIGELRCLHNAWFDLEVERAEIQKAKEHVKDRDA